MELFGRVFRNSNAANPLARNVKPYLPLLLYVAASLLIAAIYAVSFRHIEKLIEDDKLRDLGAIADAKVGQIVHWRDAQRRVGESFSRDSPVAAEFGLWLGVGTPPDERRQRLRRMLAEIQYVNGYLAVSLLDREGRARMSAGGRHEMAAEDGQLAARAMDSREVVFADFHRNSRGAQSISLDFAAPLVTGSGPSARVVGAVLVQIDPAQFLYPLLQAWPTRSETAETLLTRRDGDDALFLSNVRHREGAALKLRVPLSREGLPTAMAVRGATGTAEGADYRGVPVVAEMRPVPGTTWFMVSKIDREELFAPLNRLRNWSMALASGFVSTGGILMFLWLRNRRARYSLLRAQHDAAVQRELLTRHYEYLTRYANDIILVTDEESRIIEANARALQVYGYSAEEFRQLRIRGLCDCATDTVLCRERADLLGEQGEFRFESMTRRKDGSVFPVEVSGREIEVEGVKYLQFIMRDITERRQAEDALRKSEMLLNESQQMAKIGSWDMDLVNNELYWSDENHRIFEVDRRQPASYETFLGIVHPDDREMVNQAYTESVRDHMPYRIVHRLLFPDQRIKYVQEWCETYYDSEGKPLRSVGTTQDITERQLVKNELRKSIDEVEDMYNHAPCGYHSIDKHGLILRINDTELQWLGYTRDEVVGKLKITDFYTQDSREFFRKNYPQFMETGAINGLEMEVIRKDGSILNVLINSTAIYDSEGRYVMSRSTLYDITDRKLAEKMLIESEERFRIMADLAPIMIWMAEAQDQPGCCGASFFNQGWHNFTGLSQDQAQGCNWLNVVHPEDRMRCCKAFHAASQSGQPFRLEYRLRHHDGRFRWVQDSAIPRFTNDGRFLGFIGTCIDTSEERSFEASRGEMEHAGRLNLAGEMASGLAHELSQPLTAANNYLDACLRRMDEQEWDRAKLQQAVKLAYLQTDRAGKIIGQLKNLVRKQGHERSMTNINQVIKNAINLMEREFQHQFVTVALDLSSLPVIPANRIEIEQVLINLMKNAVEAMEGAPQRELCIATRVAESGDILVTVSDSGCGIAAEQMDKIFNPFHTSKQDGLGLGLAICRTLVENYGGRIWAEPGLGSGTDFNFTLSAGR